VTKIVTFNNLCIPIASQSSKKVTIENQSQQKKFRLNFNLKKVDFRPNLVFDCHPNDYFQKEELWKVFDEIAQLFPFLYMKEIGPLFISHQEFFILVTIKLCMSDTTPGTP
jgi:hypothetical protein